MKRVIIDLAGYAGTESPCVVVSRATSLNGPLVLHDFDARQITKRRSEDLRKELNRIMLQKWLTTAKYGNNSDRGEAERKIKELTGRDTPKGVKRKASKGNEPGGGTKKAKLPGKR